MLEAIVDPYHLSELLMAVFVLSVELVLIPGLFPPAVEEVVVEAPDVDELTILVHPDRCLGHVVLEAA